ncbi:hypothetical protein [Elizabethkingia sp. JS20170427COW]|uniref:hypothetical protein n=1 Tax=Elizabethkingia sp. JS20170427COW TaxID=2583851 RepID=UPI001110F650|nr:hypothetical protein [Elizabethkingia sp. JS20170427COW]QCX52872.1 hypothetical protein FGE20_03530 [Elizabethkingia sp. JS20170427COW]
MKKYILSILSFIPFIVYSQIGIGTQAPQQLVHIDAAKNNNNADPSGTPEESDDVVITNKGMIGVGTITPKTRLDLRGEGNKNAIGIGITNQTASAANIGAIQYYNDGTEWGISYSNGTNWVKSPSSPVKALVYAGKSTAQTFYSGTASNVIDWVELVDRTNSFEPSTGVFTAPRDGVYIVSFNIVTVANNINNNSNTETILTSTATEGVREFRCVNAYPGYNTGTANNRTGNNCTAIFKLKTGETIRPNFLQNFNSSASSTSNQIDNSITITQL